VTIHQRGTQNVFELLGRKFRGHNTFSLMSFCPRWNLASGKTQWLLQSRMGQTDDNELRPPGAVLCSPLAHAQKAHQKGTRVFFGVFTTGHPVRRERFQGSTALGLRWEFRLRPRASRTQPRKSIIYSVPLIPCLSQHPGPAEQFAGSPWPKMA